MPCHGKHDSDNDCQHDISLLDAGGFRAIFSIVRIVFTLLLVLLPAKLVAIPNSVFGPIVAANSPLNGQDLTPELTAAALWTGSSELPGTWKDEGRIAAAEISHLLARPKLLGREVVLLRATKRDGRLVALDATFADAGSFFGYFDEKMPENLDRRAQREELDRRVATRQAEFSESMERREFLFLESWSGRDIPRRMRAEEMAATTYLSFIFRP